ncbi:MAG: hypothetical protein ACI8Q6_002101, partial [Granulosicoccus sp.]
MPNVTRRKITEHAARIIPAIAVLAALALCTAPMVQAAPNLIEQQQEALDEANSAPDCGFKTGSVVFAPIPFNTPGIGAGLALGAAYLFNSDENSNASIIGLGGFKSDNGLCGWLLHSKTFLIRFVHLSEAVMCPAAGSACKACMKGACLRG